MRQCKLLDATHAIQRALGARSEVQTPRTDACVIDGEFRVVSSQDAATVFADDSTPKQAGPAPGTFRDATFQSDLGARRYKLYEP